MIGAIVGEWIGSTNGIGALIIQATYNFDSPLLYATDHRRLGLLGAVLPGVISLAERLVVRWQPRPALTLDPQPSARRST